MVEVVEELAALPGARHITHADAASGSRARRSSPPTCTPTRRTAALDTVRGLGIPAEDVTLLRIESIHAGRQRRQGSAVVWADLLGQAGENARPVARYLVFMAVAGVIAAYGVLYANGILIVGAMAVSPDLLPITAICVGLVLRRLRLVGRAWFTLIVGLAFAGLTAAALTAALDLVNLLPADFKLGTTGVLSGLTEVNSSTFLVALAAGIAGMLALESRVSYAVGVAISVTTIPASAYLGVATGVGELRQASTAFVVLGINVTMLVVGATAALLVQRAVGRGAASESPPSGR